MRAVDEGLPSPTFLLRVVDRDVVLAARVIVAVMEEEHVAVSVLPPVDLVHVVS